jgi:hypothetical protein
MILQTDLIRSTLSGGKMFRHKSAGIIPSLPNLPLGSSNPGRWGAILTATLLLTPALPPAIAIVDATCVVDTCHLRLLSESELLLTPPALLTLTPEGLFFLYCLV